MRQITVHQLSAWLADAERQRPVLIDVREEWEFALCHIPGSRHIPVNQLPDHIGQLDCEAQTVLICHHGVRSAQMALLLERAGFSAVLNLAGGVDAWATAIDPEMRRY